MKTPPWFFLLIYSLYSVRNSQREPHRRRNVGRPLFGGKCNARSRAMGAIVERFPSTQLVVASIITISGIISAFILYVCIKKIWLKRCKHKISIREIGLKRFSMEEIEKATMGFSKKCLVGSGAFGNVYKGVFDEGTVLAIKRGHVDSYEALCEFKNEVELLWRVKHQNLVGLVGFCQEADKKILVYEFVPHGSLLEYMAGRARKSLTWRQRVNIAIGAAKGIAHLHERVDPCIIHRDIKPSNILIGDGFEAKVSDFGLVRTGPAGEESHVSSQIKGTPGYMDPAYCSSFHLTTSSDVFSFGVILLQLISARPAIDTKRPKLQYHIIDWARPSLEKGIVQEIIDANLLMETCNMEMMLKMGQLALKCVSTIPKNRPTMNQVAKELEDTLTSYTVPLANNRQKSTASEESVSISINNVSLERFWIEKDGASIQSVSMKCLDVNEIDFSHSVDVGNKGEFAGTREEIVGRETSSGLLTKFASIQL